MAVASASLAVSIGGAFGPTELCWRQHSMTKTPSLLLPTEKMTCLQIFQFLLENYHSSLSDYDLILACDFVISLAENTELKTLDHTTTLRSLATRIAAMGALDPTKKTAVISAMQSLKAGASVRSISEPLPLNPPRTSLGT